MYRTVLTVFVIFRKDATNSATDSLSDSNRFTIGGGFGLKWVVTRLTISSKVRSLGLWQCQRLDKTIRRCSWRINRSPLGDVRYVVSGEIMF